MSEFIVRRHPSCDALYVVDADAPEIFGAGEKAVIYSGNMTLANLFAAAPDLLKACEEANYILGMGAERVSGREWDEAYAACQEAIAKAKGEQ